MHRAALRCASAERAPASQVALTDTRLVGWEMELDSEDLCAAAALLRSKAGADGVSCAAETFYGAPPQDAPLPLRRAARQAHAPSRYVAEDSPPAARGKRKAPHGEAAASQVCCDQHLTSRLQLGFRQILLQRGTVMCC